MERPARDPIRIALDDEGNQGEAGIAFMGHMPVGGGRGGLRPQVLFDDYEGEDGHWDSEGESDSDRDSDNEGYWDPEDEEDSGYDSMSEGEEEEEDEEYEDDPPRHPPIPPFGETPPFFQRPEESAPSTSGLGSSAKRAREEDYGDSAPSTSGLGSSTKRAREEDEDRALFRRYWQWAEDSDSD